MNLASFSPVSILSFITTNPSSNTASQSITPLGGISITSPGTSSADGKIFHSEIKQHLKMILKRNNTIYGIYRVA